jgi:mannose/cellobiose epimerase-like protein (N-acyl-D-glucosamine 2-epimerase family)
MTAIAHRQFEDSAESSLRSWLATVDYTRLLHRPVCAPGVPLVERFDWHGQPIEPGFRRIRVMSRQCYVLCHAAIGGGPEARELAREAIEALIAHGIGADGQFHSSIHPDGSVLNAEADLYDIAFGLFAMAWWYRLSGDSRAIAIAERSIAHLRAELASPSGCGFIARAGDTGSHLQNPHMHLFEATSFLAAFTGRPAFHALADDLFALAEDVLIDSVTGVLPESFDAAWRPVEEGGVVRVEPGHQYEWVWLLHRYGELASQPRAFALAETLFAFAHRHGHDAATGLIFDAVDHEGRPIARDLRVWPNTEALKAQVAMQERYGEGPGFDGPAIRDNVRRIRQHFLTRQSSGPAAALSDGWWIDYLEGDSLRPKCNHIPASSLYHIFLAFTELLRYRAGHDPFSGQPW